MSNVTIHPVPAATSNEHPHRKRLIILVILGVLVGAIGVSAIFGGLNARPSGPKKGRANVTYDQGLFKVRVVDVYTQTKKDEFTEKTMTMLVARLHVTSKDDTTRSIT